MSVILSIMLIQFLVLVTPGPDFFFVTQTAVSRSRAEALCSAVGITLGVAFWAALSLIGLQWIFEQFAWLHRALLVAGGLYLLWMGFHLLREALRKPVASAGKAEPTELPVSKVRAFTMALFTNLANAKVLVYFSSIFTVMVTPDMSELLRWSIFGVVVAETFVWFTLVALVFHLPVMRRAYFRLSRWIDGVAGALFGAFGVGLLWEARRY